VITERERRYLAASGDDARRNLQARDASNEDVDLEEVVDGTDGELL
jgi:hypothetical protein